MVSDKVLMDFVGGSHFHLPNRSCVMRSDYAKRSTTANSALVWASATGKSNEWKKRQKKMRLINMHVLKIKWNKFAAKEARKKGVAFNLYICVCVPYL